MNVYLWISKLLSFDIQGMAAIASYHLVVEAAAVSAL